MWDQKALLIISIQIESRNLLYVPSKRHQKFTLPYYLMMQSGFKFMQEGRHWWWQIWDLFHISKINRILNKTINEIDFKLNFLFIDLFPIDSAKKNKKKYTIFFYCTRERFRPWNALWCNKKIGCYALRVTRNAYVHPIKFLCNGSYLSFL